jgi:hypothetical protein
MIFIDTMPSKKKKSIIPKIKERIPNALQRNLLPEYTYMISVSSVSSDELISSINNLDDDPIDLNNIINSDFVSGSGLKIIRYLKNLKN